MEKVDEFCAQLRALKGNRRMLAGLFAGMFVELTALFAIPFFLYRGLGLTGGSFWELVLVPVSYTHLEGHSIEWPGR